MRAALQSLQETLPSQVPGNMPFLLSTDFSAPTGEQLQLRFKATLSLVLLVYTDLGKCSPEASKT